MKRSSVYLILSLLSVFVLILGLALLTPLVTDDYAKLAVHSFGDIVTEALAIYDTHGGRVGSWTWILFLIYIPHWLSSSLLASVFVLLVVLVNMHALGPDWKKRLTWKHIVAVHCLLWLCIPSFGQVFFWRTGSYYGMCAALFLAFLWPYRLLLEKERVCSALFWFLVPLAILGGLSDYNTTIVCAASAFAAGGLACCRGKRTPLAAFLPPVLLLAGFFVIYTAPGNTARLGQYDDFAALSFAGKFILHCKEQLEIQGLFILPYCVLAVGLYGLARWRSHPPRSLCAGGMNAEGAGGLRTAFSLPPLLVALYFFLAAQAAQWAFMFAPSPAARAYTSAIVFLLIAALAPAYEALARLAIPGCGPGRACRKAGRALLAAVLVWCMASMGTAYFMFARTKAYMDSCVAIAQAAAPGSDVCVPPGPYRSSSYLFFGQSHQLTDDRNDWRNVLYADHFGLGSIALCPQDLALVSTQDTDAGLFTGFAVRSELAFTYVPSDENAAYPFVVAFPLPARNIWREPYEVFLRTYMRESSFFKKTVRRSYLKVSPDSLLSGEYSTGRGTMPHVEHASSGFVVHYDGDLRTIVAVIPIRIIRAEQTR